MSISTWSWVIFAVSILGFLISGQWLPWGWLVVAFPIQLIYLAYGWQTRQPGYFASAVFFAVIGILNFWKARRLKAALERR